MTEFINKLDFRSQFPLLRKHSSLIYLDSAATTLKPDPVIKAVDGYNEEYTANVHRGLYRNADISTEEYEGAREAVAEFINASYEEIIFTRNTTESINLFVNQYVLPNLYRGDKVLIQQSSHHSNILPWARACEQKNAQLIIAPIAKNGLTDFEAVKKTAAGLKFVALTHVSNVTGEILEIEKLVPILKSQNVTVFLDSAQSIHHLPTNVSEFGVDALAFSGHKTYGPTGIGVLFVKKKIMSKMVPLFWGGSMVLDVDRKLKPELNDIPWRFEAGTPAIAEAIGLAEAIKFINRHGFKQISRLDKILTDFGLKQITAMDRVKLLGPKSIKNRLPIFTFYVQGIHPHDLAYFLSECNVAVRAGKMCAAPSFYSYDAGEATRISCALYTSTADLDFAFKKVDEGIKRFAKR